MLLVLTNLAMLGTNQLGNSIRLLALQGLALAAIVPLAGQEGLKMAFRRDLWMIGATLFLYWRRRSRAPRRFPNLL